MVVDATEFSSQFPASSVLVLGERDELLSSQKYNFWLAESNNTEGQGFTIRLDTCARMIGGCQIKNKGVGSSLGLNGLAAMRGKGGRLEPGTPIKVTQRL